MYTPQTVSLIIEEFQSFIHGKIPKPVFKQIKILVSPKDVDVNTVIFFFWVLTNIRERITDKCNSYRTKIQI